LSINAYNCTTWLQLVWRVLMLYALRHRFESHVWGIKAGFRAEALKFW